MSDYQYSEELHEQLNSNFGINESLIGKEVEIKETEKLQLFLYIRNYDSNGNLITSPRDAVKTVIDTYEKVFTVFEWETSEPTYTYDENNDMIFDVKKNYRDVISNDPLLYIPDELKDITPIVIDETTFLSEGLINYFNSFNRVEKNESKTIFIKFNSTTDKYKYYSLDDYLIRFLLAYGYKTLGFDLDDKNIVFDDIALLETEVMSFDNVNIVMNDNIGIETDSLYLNNVNISIADDETIKTFGVLFKAKCKFDFITFDEYMCKFEIGSKETNMIKWMNNSFSLYSLSYESDKKEYDGIDPMIKIRNIKDVSIGSVYIKSKRFNSNIFLFSKCAKINLNSITLKADERFEKNLISINDILELIACGIKIEQNSKTNNTKPLYVFSISGGTIFSEYSFMSVISKYIGICQFKNDYTEKVSFTGCVNMESNKTFNLINSSIKSLVLSNCSINNITNFIIDASNILFFGVNISKVPEVKLTPREKIYISDSSIKCDDLLFNCLDGSSVMMEGSTIKTNKIESHGDEGTGNFSTDNCTIKSKEMYVKYMKKISSSNSNYEINEIEISVVNISHFNPALINNSLKKITMLGNCNNSNLVIDNSSVRDLSFYFNKLKGNLGILYNNMISDNLVSIKDSLINLNIKILKENDPITISLKTSGECKGSIISTDTDNALIIPAAEGSFNETKRFKNTDIGELKSSKWKNFIAYGVIKGDTL
ncbi:MAG TPA: hypothetical protein PK507_02000 [bacterium]|nr:hypothetical protein [bacterium]